MIAYEKLRKRLASKGKGVSAKKVNVSSPPPTSADKDLEAKLSAQVMKISADLDTKFSVLSDRLVNQVAVLMSQNINQPSSSGQTSSGPSADITESNDNVVEVVAGGSGQGQGQRGPSVRPKNQGLKPSQVGDDDDFENDDDDDDDDDDDIVKIDSVGVARGRMAAQLSDFIYNEFSDAKPAQQEAYENRSFFEDYYALSAPPESQRKPLVLFPRVRNLIKRNQDRAITMSRESRSLSKVLAFRRRTFSVGNDPDFCNNKLLNTNFARLCRSKSIPRSRTTAVTYSDLERLERGSRTVVAGQSQALWLLSALLAQLKKDGYQPSNPALFDENISSLSATLAVQTHITAGIAELLTIKRRESYLSHAAFNLDDSIKKQLLVTPGTGTDVFNEPLLLTAIESMKEDSLLSSTSSLASMSKSRGRSQSSSRSPLDYPRAGTSGYRKRSASPSGRQAKRGRGGRGRTPSSTRGKGFRR